MQTQIKSPKKAVVYARFSSHNQTEQSIEGQLRACNDYAQRNNYIILNEYIDRALTGTTDDRPQFQQMIEDAKLREFQYVIVYKLDRFMRNRYESAIYKHKLNKCGVKLISVMENIGEGIESVLMEAILEAQAEYYSLELSQKIKRGMKETARKGKYCGRSVPIGYSVKDGYLIENPEKSMIPKYIFQRYLEGATKKIIVAELKERKYTKNSGKPIDYNMLYRMLRNETYTGTLNQSGIITENACPALITKEQFEKAQSILKTQENCGGKYKAKIPYLLSGKLFCGHCGTLMTVTSGVSQTGDIHRYYICRNKKKCIKTSERKENLEAYVIEQTMLHVFTEKRIHEISLAVEAAYKKNYNQSELSSLTKLINRKQKQIQTLVDTIVETPANMRKPFFDKMQVLQDEEKALQSELNRITSYNERSLTYQQISEWMHNLSAGDPTDPDFQKMLIKTFVNAVYVYNDLIVIYYNLESETKVTPDKHQKAIKTAKSIKGKNVNLSNSSNSVSSARPYKLYFKPLTV